MSKFFIKKKNFLAFLLAVLLAGISIFLWFAGENMTEISELVEQSKERRDESVEEFLQLSIMIQHNFIGIIEDDWERYEGEDIEGFINYSLKSIPSSAIDSIVIAIVKNDVVYEGYAFEQYRKIDFVDELVLNKHNITHIHGEGANEPFGTADRFYYTTTGLDELTVVVGFLEPVMYNQFISSLDIDIVEEINSKSVTLSWQIFALIIYVSVIGSILLWQIIRLGQEFSLEEICRRCENE